MFGKNPLFSLGLTASATLALLSSCQMTGLRSPSSETLQANAHIYSDRFANYLDGATLGADQNTYFTHREKIMYIDSKRDIHTLLDLEKVLSNFNHDDVALVSVRLAGMTRGHDQSLIAADYTNHILWQIPYDSTQNKYLPDQLKRLYRNPEMQQPNDLFSLKNGSILIADRAKFENSEIKIPGLVWKVALERGENEKIIVTQGDLTGIVASEEKNLLVVASARPCFVAAYRLNDWGLQWTKTCEKRFSVDGMDFNANGLYVPRTSLGRIDILNTTNGELIKSICLLAGNNYGKILTLDNWNSTTPDCPAPAAGHAPGLNPSSLRFVAPNLLAITFIGRANDARPEMRGHLDLLPVQDP